MRSITVKDLSKFRNKSSKTKKPFIQRLQIVPTRNPDDKSGNDYWVISLSAVCKAYTQNDLSGLDTKVQEVEAKRDAHSHRPTKNQYQRNADIMQTFFGAGFGAYRPLKALFLKNPKGSLTFPVHGVDVKMPTQHFRVFKTDSDALGAVWFIAKKDGFSKEDLGMFTEVLYHYVQRNHSGTNLSINPDLCVAVDAFSNQQVSYADLQSGRVKKVLKDTLDEIKSL